MRKNEDSFPTPHLSLEIARRGWPTLVAQLAVMLNGVLDTVMAGQLAPGDLAAVGLGASIYITVNVGLMGVLMALMPEIARHYGGHRPDLIRVDFQQGIYLAFGISLLGVLLLQSGWIWQSFGMPSPQVAEKLNRYLFWTTLSLPAQMLIRCCYCVNMGIGQPKVVMLINLSMLVAKLPLNLVFMFGFDADFATTFSAHKAGSAASQSMSWQGLGAPGCAAATAVIAWTGLFIHAAVLHNGRAYRNLRLFAKPWRLELARLKQLLWLGVPTGGGYLLEVTSFTFMSLWLASLGTSVSASHQIAANFTSLLYMIGLAISNATSNLCAQSLGAQDPRLARQYALSGMKLAVGCALLAAALTASFAVQIATAYTDMPTIISATIPLFGFVAAYHLFDVAQTILSFVLRAYRVVTPTVWIFLICLWLIGLGLGYFLSFGLSKSFLAALLPTQLVWQLSTTPYGFWTGALVGVTCSTICLGYLLARLLKLERLSART